MMHDRMPWKEASAIAVNICQRLQSYCDKLNIAGSVRRGKPEVHDIEICCQPKIVTDLFGGSTNTEPIADFTAIVLQLGVVEMGKTNGRYMKILLPQGIKLDLFMPEPTDYYRQLVIRTGPSDYSHKIIAAGWKAKGWCGTSDGLRLMNQCSEKKQPDGKSKWKPILNATKPPTWASEEEFYEWLDIPYLKPTQRIL